MSVFWAFANSITTPEGAKKNYGVMVSGSKLGGILGALVGLIVLWSSGATYSFLSLSHTGAHQFILVISSILLFCVPFIIHLLMKTVPGHKMHGYEAVYRAEKQRKKEGKEGGGIFSGFKMLIKYPYVFSIFGLILFYEIINVVLNYQLLATGLLVSNNISEYTTFLFKFTLAVHIIGFFITLLGTRALLMRFGIRR